MNSPNIYVIIDISQISRGPIIEIWGEAVYLLLFPVFLYSMRISISVATGSVVLIWGCFSSAILLYIEK